MRSVSPSFTAKYDASRVPTARMTLRDKRLLFSSLSSDAYEMNMTAHDADIYSGGILRAASVTTSPGVRKLVYQYITDPNSWPVWTETSISLAVGAGVAVYGNRIFFEDNTLACKYVDFAAGVLGVPVTIILESSIVSFAPVSATEVYMQTYVTNATRLKLATIGVGYDTAPSNIYAAKTQFTTFDAVRLAGKDYIFLSDNDNKRALWMYKQGSIWSEMREVLPIDVVDDTSLFIMGGASVINSQVWIGGLLKRADGNPLHIYMRMIDDHFTIGREMYVAEGVRQYADDNPTEGETPYAKLLELSNTLYYLAPSVRYSAGSTYLTGYDDAAKKLTTGLITQAAISMDNANPHRLTMIPASSLSSALLIPGSQLDLEVGYDGVYTSAGTFDIDFVGNARHQTGQQPQVLARSYAMKRLDEWHSDSSYDYWSQTKQVVDPNGELIRIGTWEGSPFGQKYLNVDGYLYSAERSAKNMMAYGLFTPHSDVGNGFENHFGVVLNFHSEIQSEATARLAGAEPGIFGFRLVYRDGAGVSLDYLYPGQPDLELHLEATTLTYTSAPLGIMGIYADGYVYCYISENNYWVFLFSQRIDSLPHYGDHYGRGAIYTKNYTPHANSYSVDSEETYIPLDSSIPGAATVIIDDEIMTVNGTSSISLPVVGLTYVDAGTLTSNTSIGGSSYQFGNDRACNVVRQDIPTLGDSDVITGVSVYVSKDLPVGEELTVAVHCGPINAANPIGTELASASVAVTDTIGWVDVNFYNDVSGHPDVFIIMYPTNNPSHPTADQAHTVNLGAGAGFYSFNESSDTWTNLGQIMPYKVYGYSGLSQNKLVLTGVPNGTYDNCVLRVMSGTGIGTNFPVTTMSDWTSGVGTFYTTKDPRGLIDGSSVFDLLPAILVTRGQNSTTAANHADGVCSIYSTAQVDVEKFGYFSTEMDMSLEWMIAEICAKAGVEYMFNRTIDQTLSLVADTPVTLGSAHNLILKVDIPSMPASGFSLLLRSFGTYPTYSGIEINVHDNAIEYYGSSNLRFGLGTTVENDLTVSLFNNYLSFWSTGRYLGSFYLDPTDQMLGGDDTTIDIAIVAFENTTLTVTMPELSNRVDNYILDMGSKGLQLINELIQERRIFVGEQDGKLYCFNTRATIPDTNTRAVLSNVASTSTNLATRTRLVGADIIERNHAFDLANYGNVFSLVYSQRLDYLWELEKELEHIMTDVSCNKNIVSFTTAYDPRIEVNDKVPVELVEGTKTVIAQAINVNIVSQDGVFMDMTIEGVEA